MSSNPRKIASIQKVEFTFKGRKTKDGSEVTGTAVHNVTTREAGISIASDTFSKHYAVNPETVELISTRVLRTIAPPVK